eukprot:453509-Pyramimonas_sp.AAC.2
MWGTGARGGLLSRRVPPSSSVISKAGSFDSLLYPLTMFGTRSYSFAKRMWRCNLLCQTPAYRNPSQHMPAAIPSNRA